MIPNNAITFCRPKEFYGCFSNFSRHTIKCNHGFMYATTEHYYQAMKHYGKQLFFDIIKTSDPFEAKKLAYLQEPRKDWEDIKYNVMLDALRFKVKQHPKVWELLLSTGEKPLIEISRKDKVWGMTPQGEGLNWLGKAWMTIREEIQQGRLI